MKSRFGCAGITKAARAQRELGLVRSLVALSLINDVPMRSENIECDGRSAPVIVVGTIPLHQRHSVAMVQGQEVVKQAARQTPHPFMDHLHANGHQMSEADGYRREIEVVDCSIFKCCLAFDHLMPLALDASCPDGTSGKPGALQFGQCRFAYQQTADARRVAEHFIERDRHKIGMPFEEIQSIGWREGSAIHEHIPPSCMGLFNPLQWVLYTAEVGLGRVGKQVKVLRTSLIESMNQLSLVHTEVRSYNRHICEGCPFRFGKLADAVDRVVVIEGEQVLPTRSKGIRLPYKLKRTTGIGSEDDRIFIRGRIEVGEHIVANMLNKFSGGLGGRVRGVGVAEHTTAEQRHMLTKLGFGI